MSDRPTYPGLRRDGSSPPAEVATVVNNQLQGALNIVIDVAIGAEAELVTVQSDRLHPWAVVLVPPGSSITGASIIEAGLLQLTVVPGPARSEPVVVVG